MRWPPRARIRRLLWGGFFLAAAALLALGARKIEWQEVGQSLRGYRAETLLRAAALAAFGHLVYTTYDVLGRFYTRHELPLPRVMAIGFVSYAFNLNAGPLIGGAGFRFRLYSRFGLDAGVIGRVLGFSILTNWLGYGALAGAMFASEAVPIPEGWKIGSTALKWIGLAMLSAVAAFLLLCAGAERRRIRVRGVAIELPPLQIALVQPVVAAISWSTIGLIVWVLFEQRVAFATALGVALLAAVAGVLTHIPAGLGVLETVFVLTLGHALPRSEILAALLAYRAVYYLAPLLVAVAVYGILEARGNPARLRI
jgi:uncharacterized membrane protein YbhN (UPF0104 family)